MAVIPAPPLGLSDEEILDEIRTELETLNGVTIAPADITFGPSEDATGEPEAQGANSKLPVTYSGAFTGSPWIYYNRINLALMSRYIDAIPSARRQAIPETIISVRELVAVINLGPYLSIDTEHIANDPIVRNASGLLAPLQTLKARPDSRLYFGEMIVDITILFDGLVANFPQDQFGSPELRLYSTTSFKDATELPSLSIGLREDLSEEASQTRFQFVSAPEEQFFFFSSDFIASFIKGVENWTSYSFDNNFNQLQKPVYTSQIVESLGSFYSCASFRYENDGSGYVVNEMLQNENSWSTLIRLWIHEGQVRTEEVLNLSQYFPHDWQQLYAEVLLRKVDDLLIVARGARFFMSNHQDLVSWTNQLVPYNFPEVDAILANFYTSTRTNRFYIEAVVGDAEKLHFFGHVISDDPDYIDAYNPKKRFLDHVLHATWDRTAQSWSSESIPPVGNHSDEEVPADYQYDPPEATSLVAIQVGQTILIATTESVSPSQSDDDPQLVGTGKVLRRDLSDPEGVWECVLQNTRINGALNIFESNGAVFIEGVDQDSPEQGEGPVWITFDVGDSWQEVTGMDERLRLNQGTRQPNQGGEG